MLKKASSWACLRTDPQPERAKRPERTPVREDGFATENAAGGLFQHPAKGRAWRNTYADRFTMNGWDGRGP